jgi:hypothetical protein
MTIAWIYAAFLLLRDLLLWDGIGVRLAAANQRLRERSLDGGLRRWLRKLYPNSREVQGDAAISAGWLAAYVAIGVLWHAVHAALALVDLPFKLLDRAVR